MAKFFNILLVEDDSDDIELFREALRNIKLGDRKASEVVDVAVVFNGAQAVDYLLRKGLYRNRTNQDPDFVVLDLNLPIKTGFEVLQDIKNHSYPKGIPFYILSTSHADEHEKKCRELGATAYYCKPTKIDELRDIVEKMLLIDIVF